VRAFYKYGAAATQRGSEDYYARNLPYLYPSEESVEIDKRIGEVRLFEQPEKATKRLPSTSVTRRYAANGERGMQTHAVRIAEPAKDRSLRVLAEALDAKAEALHGASRTGNVDEPAGGRS
jgi:hypothetical protein